MINDFREALRIRIAASAAQLGSDPTQAAIEVTREEKFGDLTTNAAMVWAKALKKNPRELATELIATWNIPDEIFSEATVAGPGFINLRLRQDAFAGILHSILEHELPFGHLPQTENCKRWLLEFVSANPTGPLNIVSARAAAIGDALARIIESQGQVAHREYYINDAGNQVRLFGESVVARMKQERGEAAEIPEEGYRGSYVVDLAKKAIAEGLSDTDPESIGNWAIDQMVAAARNTLEKYRVNYQHWFKETTLRKAKAEWTTLETLRTKGYVYEQDGAQFLRTTADGLDDKDRVVVTSQGRPTYFLPDIAYHLDKYNRGFNRSINFLGPDHHGSIARMKAALRMLDIPDDFHEIRLIQQVNLMRGGEAVKMSKRAGELVTLEDLLEELGDNATAVDVARYFFLQRKFSTPLDFDQELAKQQSEENPAFYVQYAHARICSILRQLQAGSEADYVWQDRFIELLSEDETRAVIRKLMEYPIVLDRCVQALDPNNLTGYLTELAGVFHKFYHHHRVLGQERDLMSARVLLLLSVKKILADGLDLLGINAPEQM